MDTLRYGSKNRQNEVNSHRKPTLLAIVLLGSNISDPAKSFARKARMLDKTICRYFLLLYENCSFCIIFGLSIPSSTFIAQLSIQASQTNGNYVARQFVDCKLAVKKIQSLKSVMDILLQTDDSRIINVLNFANVFCRPPSTHTFASETANHVPN